MGSASDLPVMEKAAAVLEELSVSYEMTVVSAHRTPERMMEHARNARSRGIRVIIAGAGGAAHLPGMTASITPLPTRDGTRLGSFQSSAPVAALAGRCHSRPPSVLAARTPLQPGL